MPRSPELAHPKNGVMADGEDVSPVSSNHHDHEKGFVDPSAKALVPQPSDDPRDPLNWSSGKKYATFAILCLSTFTGLSAATANILALVEQAKTYHTTPTTASYTASAGIAGLIVGPLIVVPLARIVGVTSCTFWSLVLVVAISIWSAEAAGPHDYTSFAVSRGLVGVFCVIPQILTGGVIVDIFFLHQRGKAFAIYSTVYTIATVAGPAFSGFIVQHTQWPVTIWWTVGSNGLAAVLVGLFVDDTAWDRERGGPVCRKPYKESWAARRIATLLPGTAVAPPTDVSAIIKSTVAPYIIGISPPTIMAGLYTLINFSWFIMITIESSIILEVTDFHFTPQQTAAFIFASWIGAILAVIYGTLLNDRIPMYLSRRSGMWHPEYRLHTAWFPGVFATPVGCGIFGAALIYKLHYMVLALGTFFIALGGVASVPVSINYVIECFRHYPQEVGAALNLYRLCFGLAIPFFYDQWEETVGVNWVYGMSAFISLFGFMLVVLLMWKGPAIRKLSLWKDTSAGEEGTKVA